MVPDCTSERYRIEPEPPTNATFVTLRPMPTSAFKCVHESATVHRR
jgi:hypothetical protein